MQNEWAGALCWDRGRPRPGGDQDGSEEVAGELIIEEDRQRCYGGFFRLCETINQFLTKAELRDPAIRELKVSKNSFDYGWIDAIKQPGRYDWYEPLRRRLRVKS
jgi:hypothetical protein